MQKLRRFGGMLVRRCGLHHGFGHRREGEAPAEPRTAKHVTTHDRLGRASPTGPIGDRGPVEEWCNCALLVDTSYTARDQKPPPPKPPPPKPPPPKPPPNELPF